MNRLVKSFILAFALALSACGTKTETVPELTDAEWLALSQSLAPTIDASKPGRSASMSAVSQDGQFILDAYQGAQSLVLSQVGGGIIAEKNLDTPAVRILFSTAGEPVSVSETGEISIWNAKMDGAPETLSVSGFSPLNVMPRVTTFIALEISADRIAIGGWNEAKGLYDRSTGEKISDLSYSTTWIDRFKISPDGTMIAANHGNEILIYRLSDGAFLGQYHFAEAFNDTGGDTIRDFEFSSDSKDIHVNHWYERWRVMNINSNAITDLGSLGKAGSFALSDNNLTMAMQDETEDGRQVVLRSRNRVAIGSPDILPLPEDTNFYANDFAFSPDGEKLAAFGSQYPEDGTRILIWDIANKAPLMDYMLERPSTGFEDMFDIRPVFSPDGNYVSIAFPDHAAYVFPASRDRLFQTAKDYGLSIKE